MIDLDASDAASELCAARTKVSTPEWLEATAFRDSGRVVSAPSVLDQIAATALLLA